MGFHRPEPKGKRQMETIGIRRFRENLSRYLRQVRRGEQFIITDRKEQVAILQPISVRRISPSQQLTDLVRENKARWSGKKPRGILPLQAAAGRTVSDAVIEDRR